MSMSAVVHAHDTTTPEQELAAAVGHVNLEAGITPHQADAIARFYCRHHIAECGGTDAAVDRGSRWEVTPRLGVAGIPGEPPVVIDKHTGQVSWKHGPTFDLARILVPKELPSPLHTTAVRWPRHLPRGAHRTTIKVEFVVLPSGATSFVSFEHSSGRLTCDRAVRQAVEQWQYAPRKTPMTLVESMDTCTY